MLLPTVRGTTGISPNSRRASHPCDGCTAAAPLSFLTGPDPFGPNQPLREETMKTWRKPKVREVSVGTEINAYACARL